jgi:hypothetical protein
MPYFVLLEYIWSHATKPTTNEKKHMKHYQYWIQKHSNLELKIYNCKMGYLYPNRPWRWWTSLILLLSKHQFQKRYQSPWRFIKQELKTKLVKVKMIDVRPLIIIIGHMVSYCNSHVINNLKFPTFHKHARISM